MQHNTARHIVDALGSEAITARLGVSDHSVRHAKWIGKFPASWFAGIADLCQERGVECPMGNFNFKSPSDTSSAPNAAQDDARSFLPADQDGNVT